MTAFGGIPARSARRRRAAPALRRGFVRLTASLGLLAALVQALVPIAAMAAWSPQALLSGALYESAEAASCHGTEHSHGHGGGAAELHRQLCAYCLVLQAAPLAPAVLKPECPGCRVLPSRGAPRRRAEARRHRLTPINPRAPPQTA